jgi:hypothetical protein
MTSTVVHLHGSAAGALPDIDVPVRLAQGRGWTVCVGLTPTAAGWLGPERIGELAELTGHPVKWQPRGPGESDPWPMPDAVVIAPATLNTVNRIALGLTDSVVARAGIEAIGRRLPLVILPCLNQVLAAHPQFEKSVEVLRGAGAQVLLGVGGFTPNPSGGFDRAAYPWEAALDAASAQVK